MQHHRRSPKERAAERQSLAAGLAWVFVAALISWAPTSLLAQQPATAPAGTPPSPPTAASAQPAATSPNTGVVERPEIFYLIEKKTGALVPVPNFPLEEYERWRRQADAAVAEVHKPDYRLESLEVSGTADANYARLDCKIRIFVDAAGWVRVPIDLGGAVLGKQVQYQGPGKFAVQFDTEVDQYVVWLQGAGDKPHEITVSPTVRVERIAGASGIRLKLPRAWSGSLQLQVPGEGVTAQVSAGAVLEGIQPSGKQSSIRVSGVGGEFQLTWDQPAAALRRATVLLEANADVLAVFDGRSVSYEMQVNVNSFGGEFERFQIRLPPSTVLVEEGLADVEIVRQSGKNAEGEVYEIRRTAGPTKVLVIRLKALRSLTTAGPQGAIDFGGFEVLGAVRQWGYLGIVIEGDWQVLWGNRSHVRQVDAAPEAFRGRDVSSIFEYFGRPYSLVGQIVPRETRVSVDPTYLIDVSAKRATLTAVFPYRVGGAKAFAMPIEFGDWLIDDMGPAAIVKLAAMAPGQTKPLTVPLLQPSTGEFEITVKAHRDIPEGAKAIDLTLPHPKADVVGDAVLSVHAAENVELIVRDASHNGLHRQSSDAAPAATRAEKSWIYVADAADARFRADFRILARSVSVKSSTTVNLERDGGRVKQRFTFDVAREPVDGLEFDVDPALTEGGRLDFKLGADSIPWGEVNHAAGEARPTARIRAEMPMPKSGTFELTAEYPLGFDPAVPLASMSVKIPLLVPVDAPLRESLLTIDGSEGLRIQHIDERWARTDADALLSPDDPITYRSTESTVEAALGLRWDEPDALDDTVVERLWVQSVVFAGARQERAVFRFTTSLPAVQFHMPPGAAGAACLVNGARAELMESTPPGVATLRLPRPVTESYVVDLRYRATNGTNVFTAPRLGSAAVHHVYRQLVFAAEACVLRASAEYLPEYEWNWRGALLTRRPLLSQRDLEDWVGARHESAVPDRANVYLYSGYGDAQPLEVITVTRTALVLVVAGTVLAFCWLLLYVPALRHPALLVTAAAAIGTAGALYPDVAPLVIQVAGLGALLAFTAVLLERNVNRRRRMVRPNVDSPASASRESTRTRVVPQPSPQSTATVDLPMSRPEAGGAA